ncbi:Hypothetical predicted protein [Paramuricea clavata]|uniref:Uncharacterized protein n=1 Tax=Paramuricea clavata TaxID=317549 RepID=A0A6S7HZA0_PARCT|nr:Hypothetical predicted protein [Paramuricea clavata]
MKDPYVTAYLKADVLPLTIVIGDGNEYNSEKEKYINQPLKLNSIYIAFLRFFESQDSYYSTGWSSNVKTLIEAPVECANGQEIEVKTRMDLLIPLVILALCLLFSLGVIIYQRRLIQNSIRQACHKCETSGQSNRKGGLDSPSSNKTMRGVQAAPRHSYVNVSAYESPDYAVKSIERNEAESKPGISTDQDSSTYMSLKELENFYQSLQPPG